MLAGFGLEGINFKLSGSSGNFPHGTSTLTAVTNLTVTIIASGTKPIFFTLVSDTGLSSFIAIVNASGSTALGAISLFKDTSEYQTHIIENVLTETEGGSATNDANDTNNIDSFKIPIGGVNWFDDSPSAGSHTYLVKVRINTGDEIRVRDAKLLAIELI